MLIWIAFGLVTVSATGVAQGIETSSPTQELPVTEITLFTSGVGYFQHDGFVTGDTSLSLTFAVADINDLLKSLVLQDFDGGTVEAVSYPSQDPLSRILDSFSLNIADNPSLAQLIDRARGSEIVVEAGSPVVGTILGVEYLSEQRDGASVRTAIVNLNTDGTLKQIRFSEIRSIRFTDPALQDELQAALQVIAANRQAERKTITIQFSGSGRRRVRIGYIRAVPVWKASYRVVLGDDESAQIQGWAIVENTGESDWNGVELSLVAEQPISFVMDLYSPIYRSRPRVSPSIGTTVAPQAYDRAVARAPSAEPSRAMASEAYAPEMDLLGGLADDFDSGYEERESSIDLSQGVASAAVAGSATRYRISHPVSIARRGAALIPIVAALVPLERVSIYDPNVFRNRPLLGAELTNSTDAQLLEGPVTIFDGATYAGDARLPNMVGDEERLVSFAVDLETAIIVDAVTPPQEITRVRIVRGVLEVTRTQQIHTEYIIDRVSDDEMNLLIVHPKRSGWDLISKPEPVAETSASLRFMVPVSGSMSFEVLEQQLRSQSFGLTSLDSNQIAFYLSEQATDAATARALERVRELQGVVSGRERDRRAIELQINDIYREQQRIRSNIEVLDSNTDLYKRYLAELTEGEDELDVLEVNLAQARLAEQAARDALADYVEGL